MSLLDISGLGTPAPDPASQQVSQNPAGNLLAPLLQNWGQSIMGSAEMFAAQQANNAAFQAAAFQAAAYNAAFQAAAFQAAAFQAAALQAAAYNATPLPTFTENVPDDEATIPVNLKSIYSSRTTKISYMQRCLHV